MDNNCKKCFVREEQSVTDAEVQLLTQYIPYRIVRAIGSEPCCVFDKKIQRFSGTVVYFDIIGFTPIVLNYISTNRDIADLTATLSEFYSVIIEVIRQFGGSVYQFAGDSLLICFEQIGTETSEANTCRALAAMLRALELSDNYNALTGSDNGFVLRPKIGISSGTIYQILLGTRDLFITPVIIGTTVHDAVLCEKECRTQEIILSPAAWRLCTGHDLERYSTECNGFYHLHDVPRSFAESVCCPEYIDTASFIDNPYFYNRMAAFINPVIRQQTKKSFLGFAGEYKNVTCIMAKFDGPFVRALSEERLEDCLDVLNEIYLLLQNKACRYGGYATKPDLTDKGVVFPVFFGTPSALENKERNAVLCAAEILLAAKKNDGISSVTIGIGTGMVYSGEFGGILRKDYTIIGNSVNFASRLMTHTEEQYGILMDESTKKYTESICETKRISGITCKGYNGEQTAYLVTDIKKAPQKAKRNDRLIGRQNELNQLIAFFRKSQDGQLRCVPIVGEAGMGKTFLVEQFLSGLSPQSNDVAVFTGTCYQYEEKTAFFCWRSVIKKLICMSDGISDVKAGQFVSALFARCLQDEMAWIPVFLNMLGFDFTESLETADIALPLKQRHFFSLVERLLVQETELHPVIIILEDIHWCDAVSFNMLDYLVCSHGEKRLMVITLSRDIPVVTDFFVTRSIPVMYLKQLTDGAAAALTDLLLNLKDKEPLLKRKIVATADGNPFFIENIVNSLIESGTLIEDDDGRRLLSDNIKSIQNIVIPSSIGNIILVRLNALKFEEQVICKTASAIGKSFYSDCLRELLPEGISETAVVRALSDFETYNIIVRDASADTDYAFTHGIIHDVIYDTILDATKKELNFMILGYLEKRYENNYLPVVEKLVYHAREAKVYGKVFYYAFLAAKKAERLFSASDTITHCLTALAAWNGIEHDKDETERFRVLLVLAEAYRIMEKYEQALQTFHEIITGCSDREIRADALRGSGRCFQEQGQFEDAVHALEQALVLLGKRPPKSLPVIYVAILKECLLQVINYGLLRTHIMQFREEKRASANTRTDILCILNKLYYFGLAEKIAWSSVANFNTVLHCRNETERFCLAAGDYAVSLVSAGLASFGKTIFEQAAALLEQAPDSKAKYIFATRYAFYFLFYNDPVQSIHMLEIAAAYFRKTGEQWELMTAEGALAQNYFLTGDFDRSIAGYEACGQIAKKLHSVMHIGWKYNKVPFMRYLRGEISASEAERQLLTGTKLSLHVHDHMTLCIHYGHLAYIACHEQQYDKALEYADLIIRENTVYKINVPHVRISYVNAVEAVCSALNHNAVPEKYIRHYHSVARHAVSRIQRLSRNYGMLAGPAARAAALLAVTFHDIPAAARWYEKSADLLKASPYQWEYENTLAFGRTYAFNAKETGE
jgi:class 3 adenylate cyclase/tetratricopeptide (TPR) repeat protein